MMPATQLRHRQVLAFRNAFVFRGESCDQVQAHQDAAACDYSIVLATARAADPAFCVLWRQLVLSNRSPQKIYQTPEYFEFMIGARKPGERIELLAISRRSDGCIVGVVPVRISATELNFGISKFAFYKARVQTVVLLGSIPAVPPGKGIAEYLGAEMLALFPSAKAVFMQAMPNDSDYWKELESMAAAGSRLGTAVMGQWRECHTMSVPDTFEQYMEKFSSKKRYNLNRQVRQLAERAGALEMTRVERPEQVAPMMRSLAGLLAPAELASISSEATFESLARVNLLHCYVLRAGDHVMAAIIGTRSPDVLHIHNIYVEKEHLALSVGTTAMHLAIKDLTASGGCRMIDFGYGTPQNEFRSSHQLETRAQVLLFDRTHGVSLLIRGHSLFQSAAESMVAQVKLLRKKAHALRAATPA